MIHLQKRSAINQGSMALSINLLILEMYRNTINNKDHIRSREI